MRASGTAAVPWRITAESLQTPDELGRVRKRLVDARDSAQLFDLPDFARQLEAPYRAICRHRKDGSSDRRIRVSA